MKAKFKSGKVITGRLAITLTKIGVTREIKVGRPAKTDNLVNPMKIVKKKTGKKKK
jgi:hypothetical protein